MGKQQRSSRIRTARLAASGSAQQQGQAARAAHATAKPGKETKEIPLLLEKLVDDDLDERLGALQSLTATLATASQSARRLLLGKNVVGHLILRLGGKPAGKAALLLPDASKGEGAQPESNQQVIMEACGALRNLAISGSTERGSSEWDTLGEMYNKGVVPPLLALLSTLLVYLRQFRADDPPLQNGAAEALLAIKEGYWDWTDNVLTLIWALAETSTKIHTALSASPALSDFLLAYLPLSSLDGTFTTRTPINIAVVAAQALLTLSEDNTGLIIPRTSLPNMLDVIASQHVPTPSDEENRLLLRVLLIGIVKNVAHPKSDHWRRLLDIAPLFLVKLLDTDISALAPSSQRLSTLQIGLEMLTELVACIDGFDEPEAPLAASSGMDEDVDEAEEDDEVPAEIGEEMMLDEDVQLDEASTSLFAELPAKLLALARLSPLQQNGSSSTQLIAAGATTPNGDDVLQLVHLRALECLNNVLLTLGRQGARAAAFVSSNAKTLQATWNTLFELVLTFGAQHEPGKGKAKQSEGDLANEDCLAATINCIWALARIGLSDASTLSVGLQEHQVLLALVDATPAATPALQTACVGALGCLAMRSQVSVDENRAIATSLMGWLAFISPDYVNNDDRFDIALQSLDSLLDVFADETRDYDVPVFRLAGALPRFEAAQKSLKGLVKRIDKRKASVLRQKADAALINLNAFVAYRRQFK
ncbi:uncharacterized protein L969DRAFT_50149 [Mixia osmundae IAM 14324]|uniref:SYO1-like TPR repeats domain-containing protein n=1 Tax=Mixia osmundae (strain CBS 9802 / IAM 14324 / JCM 22182 / KY 12970) TaxID=764103 RepID=G7E198_MIXOS|nr:uncharacterized protein L969DRAFT_50149 [Mixia osmundae IAM 14324]KEI38754.1 hypothetical protein L969DRAFT_50149 [Mixia osmundae IAM 14324]GAA96608.1 hypothetical protein E5Q_03278 [Mixia osmundae IAM 14324]